MDDPDKFHDKMNNVPLFKTVVISDLHPGIKDSDEEYTSDVHQVNDEIIESLGVKRLQTLQQSNQNRVRNLF
jgi:hypothetical protein